jgi:type IV fimbrial biogenesis protein FimT
MDKRPERSRSDRGLTLIELMIVLALLAVTLTLAAPSMSQLVHKNRVRAQASRLLAAINLVRSEAILRNTRVSMCPSDMSVSAVAKCGGDYSAGWIVFVNSDGDGDVDSTVDEVLAVYDPLPSGYALTNRSGERRADQLITYLPDGSSRRNLTLQVCSPLNDDVESWSVILNRVGRPRAARGGGSCSQG